MRRNLALACMIGLLGGPAPAVAGAWLRDDGATLLSLSHEAGRDTVTDAAQSYTTLYSEYGLTGDLTLGLDAGRSGSGTDVDAVMFLRMDATPQAVPGQLALTFGVGRNSLPMQRSAEMIRIGASWGTGWQTRLGGAWANLDLTADQYPRLALKTHALDITLGLKPSARTMITLEIWAEDPAIGPRTVRLAPSLHRRLGPGGWLRLGATGGVQNDDSLALVLGTWLEF